MGHMESMTLRGRIESLISTMKGERERCGWDDKMAACSYVKHRTGGPDGVPSVRLYDDSPVVNREFVVNSIMGAMYPRDEQWCALTPWGDRIAMVGRESRQTASDGSSSIRRGRRSEDRSRRIGSGDYVSLDDVDGAKDAMQDVVRKVLTLYSRNGYYEAKSEQVADAYVVGFGVMMTVYDVASGRLPVWHRTFDPRECLLRLDPSHTRAEVFAREFRMTSSQMWSRWHMSGRLPDKLRQDRINGVEDVYVVHELVCPRGYIVDDDGLPQGPDRPVQHYLFISSLAESGIGTAGGGMPDDVGDLHGFIEYGGYDEMPVTVLWFNRHPSSPYGTGVVEECLEEIVKLNDLARSRQRLVQLAADPMWAVPIAGMNDFVVHPGRIVGVMSNEQVPVQLTGSGSYNTLTDELANQIATLKEMMWVTIFQTLMSNTDSRKTATEVNYLKNEAAQLATGLIGNSQTCAEVEMRRVIRILVDNGLVEFGDEGIGRMYDRSVLRFSTQFINQVRNFYMIGGITEFVNYMSSLYAVYPDIVDVVDLDQTTRDVSSALVMNQFSIREKSEVEQIRDAKRILAQQQLELQRMNMQSQTNMNNAKADMAGSSSSPGGGAA